MLDLFYRSAPPSYKEFAPQSQTGGRVRACVCLVSRGRPRCGQTAMIGAPAPVAPRGWWSPFSAATPPYKAAPAYQSQTCGDDDTPPGAQTATASESPEEAEEVICDDAGAQIHVW